MRDAITQKRAKDLRNNLTKAEAIIWKYIKAGKIEGVKFRRQYPIVPYIADFAAIEIKLILEIDGATHIKDSEILHDEIRDNFLKQNGWEIMRVRNLDIYNNLDGVLEYLGKRVWELKTSKAF